MDCHPRSVMAGTSDIAPAPGDKRFQDGAWQGNPFYRALMQGHLAWSRVLHGLVDRPGLERADKDRAAFVAQMLTDALPAARLCEGLPMSCDASSAKRAVTAAAPRPRRRG